MGEPDAAPAGHSRQRRGPGLGPARHRWFGRFCRTRAPRASGRRGWERGCGGAPDSGDLLAAAERCSRRPLRWRRGGRRGRGRGAPRAGRAPVRLSAQTRQPGGAGWPPAPEASLFPWRGLRGPAAREAEGAGGSRPGLMSKSMPFLGASLGSSPSSSKANRLLRVISFPFAKSA